MSSASPLDPAPSVLSELRAATREAHASLDGRLGLHRGGLHRDRYAAYLARMLGVVAPVEATLAALPGWAAVVPDWASREKAPLARADLAALGAAVDEVACPYLPAIVDVPGGLGVAYVLEGSTLGGAVLARVVEEALGPGTPTAYFRCYGPDLGPMWTGFRATLERNLAAPSHRAAAVAAAVETFGAVERWLDAGGLLS